MAFSAGWNLTGYLCETDPVVFAEFSEAQSYLSHEIDRWWDLDADPESADERYLPAHTELHNASAGSNFHTTIDLGNALYHFWIIEVEDALLEEDEYV
jgi:hypothetical protein